MFAKCVNILSAPDRSNSRTAVQQHGKIKVIPTKTKLGMSEQRNSNIVALEDDKN